jgi:RNA polymerase sigma-70 factor (ECF subfamily)
MKMPIAGDTLCSSDSPLRQSTEESERDSVRLQRANALDRQALGTIYNDYHQRLYSYIFRRVGDVEIARDLTADVFRRFLQATANGTGPSDNLRAWLYRVAHNIVIDHYRRQQHRQSYPLEEKMICGDEDPRQEAEQQLLAAQVRVALRHLTADQQQIISLKFLEGLSNDEIAEITEKSVGAVKALQHRALAALRRQLVPFEQEVPV